MSTSSHVITSSIHQSLFFVDLCLILNGFSVDFELFAVISETIRQADLLSSIRCTIIEVGAEIIIPLLTRHLSDRPENSITVHKDSLKNLYVILAVQSCPNPGIRSVFTQSSYKMRRTMNVNCSKAGFYQFYRNGHTSLFSSSFVLFRNVIVHVKNATSNEDADKEFTHTAV